jgi:hypothetical protein
VIDELDSFTDVTSLRSPEGCWLVNIIKWLGEATASKPRLPCTKTDPDSQPSEDKNMASPSP